MGIFNLIDEQCAIRSDDDKLIAKIIKTHRRHKKFKRPKLEKEIFTVIHTARDVDYTIDGFREKNKDELGEAVTDMMKSSKNQLIWRIFL